MQNLAIINKNQSLSCVKQITAELITILAEQDEGKLITYEGNLNLAKASDGTTIKKLTKVLDDEILTTIIVFLINRLSENFNVGKKFTDEQAFMMAVDLKDIFGYETLEDILLMFRMARTGRIGDGKDFKLDSQVVFHKWIPQYLDLKADFREGEHNRIKSLSFSTVLTIEQVKNSYKRRISLQEREDRRNARINEITEGFDREMLENLITEWQLDESKKPYLRYLTAKRLTIK
ncbi:MAG TPA: hypothetical protein VIV55_10150 [Flavobacterium sp.]